MARRPASADAHPVAYATGDLVSLRRALLEWYDREQRPLPWRARRDAYAVWVSEVMLQQTTVATVLPYYAAFLKRFPDLASLANAPLDDVLACWSGLGYYRRARHLHAGARVVQAEHGGHFPVDERAARALPGVGRYTAAAVLSIAHDQPLALVDGNVRRVLARLLLLRGPDWQRDAAFYAPADALLDRDRPGAWNQALMELGATVCTPRQPACGACPARAHCRAAAAGVAHELPEVRPRRAPVDVTLAAALIEHGGRVLLVRRPQGRLMAGLWELPQTGLESSGLPDLARELRERHDLHVAADTLVTVARHAITFRRIRAEAYRARLLRPVPADEARFAWVDPGQLGAWPLSSLTRKLLAGLRRGQLALALTAADGPA
jgi:A/G-specific adenine glycosylase